MSINALEDALWQIYQTADGAAAYNADGQAYCDRFRLDDTERKDLLGFNVMNMINAGANPLLVMMAFQTVIGIEKLFEYFETVNAHFVPPQI